MAPDEETPRAPPAESGLLAELSLLVRTFKGLLGAQWELLLAEFGLARSAAWWMLLAGLAATVAGVGLGLSILALLGLALAKWWGSWVLALLALCVVQLVFLLAATVIFRRCMHWLTLPRSRGHMAMLIRDTARSGPEPASAAETRPSTADKVTAADKAERS